MFRSMIALCATLAISGLARADESFDEYRRIATELAAAVLAPGADPGALEQETLHLEELGLILMTRYEARFPECAAQYAAFRGALGEMSELPAGEIERLYHDGEGLPAAPGRCYLGRAVVVHPAMNRSRYRDGLTDEERQLARDEFLEVAGHAERIEALLAR
jgi:hypothetical protein